MPTVPPVDVHTLSAEAGSAPEAAALADEVAVGPLDTAGFDVAVSTGVASVVVADDAIDIGGASGPGCEASEPLHAAKSDAPRRVAKESAAIDLTFIVRP